jgi:lipopolysaccharide export system ATP-binding protein
LVDKNIGILITDHNVQQTLAITNKTYIMFEGKILKEGLPEDLANDPQVREAYLGKLRLPKHFRQTKEEKIRVQYLGR